LRIVLRSIPGPGVARFKLFDVVVLLLTSFSFDETGAGVLSLLFFRSESDVAFKLCLLLSVK